MINTQRIVPVQKSDLLTLYATMLSISGGSAIDILEADNAIGAFTISDDNASGLCNQPVKSVNFASGVSAATLFFVADPGYTGFAINGTATATTGDDVVGDAVSLFEAELSSGTITITRVTPA